MSVIAEQTGLTNKQQIFIDAYLTNGLNAADAARTAGYQGNAKQLSVIGNQNLNKLSIRTAIARRTQRDAVKADKRVINVYAEFEKNLEFVTKLRDAATKWLVDPENAEIFTIDPRADEIDVVYYVGDKPQRSTLAELLARVEGSIHLPTPFVKTVDLREYALKVVDRLDTTIDKFAKINGEYSKERENPESVNSVAYTARHERLRALRDAEVYEHTSKCDHCPTMGAPLDEAEFERLLDGLASRYKVDKEAVRTVALDGVEQSLGRID